MSEGLDWVMRPVLRGLCRYESLLENKFDLYDIALMNDCLDVQDENERRLSAALQKQRENK